MTSLYQQLGIHSERDAAELERDLGVRFDDFTTDDCETWIRQTVYLERFSRTRLVTLAANDADVSVRTARHWQADNTLGFNQRLEIAVLHYTDMLEIMLLQRAQAPDSPTTLLMMLARAQMPEKYGPARRGGPPRDNRRCDHHCDHNSQPTATSQYDKDFLDDVRRDLQNLKQLFAGHSDPDFTPPNPDLNFLPTDHEPLGAGFKPAHDPSAPSVASPATPSPVLGESLPRTRYGGWGEGQETSAQNLDPDLTPGNEDTSHSDLTPADPTSVGADFKPAHDPSAPSTASSPPTSPVLGEGWGEGNAPAAQDLTHSQRRQLQRKQRKHQSSRLARAPT